MADPLIPPTFSIFVRVGGAPTFPAMVGGTPKIGLALKSAQGLWGAVMDTGLFLRSLGIRKSGTRILN